MSELANSALSPLCLLPTPWVKALEPGLIQQVRQRVHKCLVSPG